MGLRHTRHIRERYAFDREREKRSVQPALAHVLGV